MAVMTTRICDNIKIMTSHNVLHSRTVSGGRLYMMATVNTGPSFSSEPTTAVARGGKRSSQARITAEGGCLKRDLRAGSVCLSVCTSVRYSIEPTTAGLRARITAEGGCLKPYEQDGLSLRMLASNVGKRYVIAN